ncbi:hypothetical protein [Tenacibaculum geojense]|uniref:Uncharacterized protein n=1 Tax=Tenacibaculum geojense TaxID=915352 RepID=A0ABW3JQR9_9FLAO
MSVPLNALLFSIIFLTNINTNLYSDVTYVEINEQLKTVTINYTNILISEEDVFLEDEILSQIIKPSIKSIEPHLKYISSSYTKEDNHVNVNFKFKFTDNKVIQELFLIDLENQQCKIYKGENISINNEKFIELDNQREFVVFTRSNNGIYNIEYRWDKKIIYPKLISLSNK